jgi:diguanylate cyclase (GGDEF)-like protein
MSSSFSKLNVGESAFEVVPTKILVIDDTPAIHADIRKILTPAQVDDELDALTAELFDDPSGELRDTDVSYEVDSAFQGNTGLSMVAKAIEAGEPYSVAFIDVRMAPGWDGIETIERIREIDDKMQIVLCTAYSDYSWEELRNRFGRNDWLLIIKKPFDVAEVQQLACALAEKWNLAQQASFNMQRLEHIVTNRTAQLNAANVNLREANLYLQKSNDQLTTEMAARRDADLKLMHMAYHDALTGLPNRTRLLTHLDACLKRAEHDDDYKFAVVFLDLDNFKTVNDDLGHHAGDEVLKHVARELASTVERRTKADHSLLDLVSRIGGDEFVVLLDDITDASDLMQFATRAREALSKPIEIENTELVPLASIGLTIREGVHSGPQDLLRDADLALYQAKGNGKGGIAVFDQEMRAALVERKRVEADLRHAVQRGELLVYYQPLVDIDSQEIIGLEALVRWEHPLRGLLRPEVFLDVAEEAGLIEEVGEWVINEVCRYASDLIQKCPIANDIRFSINVARKQLSQGNLVECIRTALDEWGLSPNSLAIEIAESVTIGNIERIQEQCQTLTEMGIPIYLDDFGTGCSSLSMVQSLPFAAVKIDESVIGDIVDAPADSLPLVQAMALLAENRRFDLIAEGIETESQFHVLRELGCNVGQGFYFARPMQADQVSELLLRKSLKTKSRPK